MARVTILKDLLNKLQFPANPPKKVIYATSLGSCPRKFAWEIREAKPKPNDFRQQQIFDIGNDYHNRYAKYLEAAGIHIASEKPIIDEIRGVRGRLDNIVEIDGVQYIVEFKTAALKNWKYVMDKANSKHRLQIGYYMQQTGIHNGLIVYLAKGAVPEDENGEEVDFPIVEHHVKFTKKLGDAVDRSIDKLKKALDMLPELTTDISQSECSYCPFRFECEYSRVSAPPTNNLFELFQRAQPEIVAQKQNEELDAIDKDAKLPSNESDDLSDFWKLI